MFTQWDDDDKDDFKTSIVQWIGLLAALFFLVAFGLILVSIVLESLKGLLS